MNLFERDEIPSLTHQFSLVYGSEDRSNPYKIIPPEGSMKREGYAIRRALRDVALSGNL